MNFIEKLNYVENKNKNEKIEYLEESIDSFENIILTADSITKRNDELLSALLEKSNQYDEYDILIFYKDLYFENRFREIDGKQYMEYIPDKMDFYQRTAPDIKINNPVVSSTPGNKPSTNTDNN